jgi:replicative DNA helicase
MSGSRLTAHGAADAPLLKVPPHSLEAEQAVLASVLLNNDLMNDVVEIVRSDDFYQGAHRTLFSTMVELYERGRAIDQLTLSEALNTRDAASEVGGLSYLSELIHNIPTTANVADYARLVKEKAILRKMIAVAQQVTNSAFQGVGEVDDFLDQTEQAIFAIAEEKIKPSYYSMAEMGKEAMREIEKLYEKKELITGVPSGFRDLDQLTAGFQKSDMVVIAARPGMGKTAFSLNVALHAALRNRLPVAIFSLEMSRQQLALRMICSEARVNFQRLRTGYLTQDEINRIVASVGRLSEAQIYCDDSGALTALELRAKARRLKKDKGIGMVIVDYLQLMRGATLRGSQDNRVQEISEISRSLKALAKEINVPVLAISQLNRGVESRTDKRPQMADLRECVTGDTLVLTTDGMRTPIRDLVGKEIDVWAMSPEGRIVPAKSECIWSVGTRPVTRVTMASGRVIRATADHRLYGAEGWGRVSDLRPGDRIAVARHVLAHLVGDGSYLNAQSLRYSTASEPNSRAVEGAARREFGGKVTRYRGRGKWHQLFLGGNGNRWHPAGVNLWLRELGIFGQRSHEKRLPSDVFRFDDEQVGLLLRHLWATDGSRLGIVARIRVVRKGDYRPVYTVDVSGSDQQKRFLETVGAFGPRVAPADTLWKELAFIESNPNVDTLPKEVFLKVKAAMADCGISHRDLAALRGTAYGESAQLAFAPSRTLLAEYANLLDVDALWQMASSDLFWDRVVDLRPDGEEDVFDLTVPGPSSWLADGVVSHNSGAIEQDSDLILFIYREEMYSKADTPEEKKGVAEIIIGKQRNGPMGVVPLTFLNQYTRFEDMARDYD